MAYPMAYRWSVLFKTRLIIAVNLCKQRVLSMCHICDFQSILLAAFRAKFLNRLVDRNQGNLCGTIIRKSYCYKTALGNFRALRSVHSVQTRSKFLSLAQTLACLWWLKNSQTWRIWNTYNELCNTSSHSLYNNELNYLILNTLIMNRPFARGAL